jgi:DeoR/GlpR family transcriptional regulator of sugar metabolism
MLLQIQLAMIRAAQRMFFCFDSTKLDRIHTIGTDQGAPEDLVRALRERGIEVVVAVQEGGAS